MVSLGTCIGNCDRPKQFISYERKGIALRACRGDGDTRGQLRGAGAATSDATVSGK